RRGRGRLPDIRGARAQRLAQGAEPEGEPRGAAAALRLGVPAQARAAGAAGGGERRHRDGGRGAGASRTRRWRDARPRGLPRSLHAAPGRRGAARRRAATARGTAARAAAVRAGAAGGRGAAAPHQPPHPGTLPRTAGRSRVSTGAERGCAPGRRGLVAGRARARGNDAHGSRGVITRDVAAFVAAARGIEPDFGPATARAAFLVSPDGFARAEESAGDNRYMAPAAAFDPELALHQHRDLHVALSRLLPTVCFAGDADTPDALFCNNVFATARADARRPDAFAPRLVVGRMRHPVRRREAERQDIRRWFRDVAGYEEIDLSSQPHPCELTGALVIDRARGLGYCGLSERCDADGAALLHAAFGLRATLVFELAPG